MRPFPLKLLPLLVVLLLAGCRKSNVAPVDRLPPATQEGRFTFGCLVNGKAFTPKGSGLGGPVLSAYYQHLNTSTAQGYYFNVAAKRRNIENRNYLISISTESLSIESGKTYQLTNGNPGEAAGLYAIIENTKDIHFKTNDQVKGELHITRLDEDKQIVSGTFWFDAVNDRGEKVEVRQGRFDMLYSR